MKKQLIGAAVAAVLMTGNAYALPTIATDTSVVYLSGASAALDYVKKLITSSASPAADRICDASKEIWVFNDTLDGKTQNAFYCTKAPGNTKLASAKSHVLIYKRSEGGSAMGVNPLVNNENMQFLNITSNPSCVQTTNAVPGLTIGQVSCDYDKDGIDATKFSTAVSDFGMSDVDPIQFTGENTPDGFAAITPADVEALTVQGASAVVFGEPVTLQLYKALQAAQKAEGKLPASCVVGDRTTEACMPNLTTAQISSLHTGQWTDWNSLKVGTVGLVDWINTNAPALAPAVNDVHVCRRVNGSGTQAQHGINFMNYPCANAGLPAAHDYGLPEGFGVTVVHELSTSGGVSSCLDELDTGTDAANAFDNSQQVGGVRWAVGLQSLEKKSNNFEFVRVDGVAPTLAHVADGSYKDWVENTFQYNTQHYSSLGTDKKALVDAVIYSAGLPEVMAALNGGFTHGFGNGSFLAVPTLYPAAANGALDLAKPVNPYSRGTISAPVENCRMPVIYNSGDAKL